MLVTPLVSSRACPARFPAWPSPDMLELTMRFALFAVLWILPLPALAECEYRMAFNLMTAAFEEVPVSCTREPVVDRTKLRAQSWRQCPVHEEVDAAGRTYSVRVCDPDGARR